MYLLRGPLIWSIVAIVCTRGICDMLASMLWALLLRIMAPSILWMIKYNSTLLSVSSSSINLTTSLTLSGTWLHSNKFVMMASKILFKVTLGWYPFITIQGLLPNFFAWNDSKMDILDPAPYSIILKFILNIKHHLSKYDSYRWCNSWMHFLCSSEMYVSLIFTSFWSKLKFLSCSSVWSDVVI